MTTTRTRMNLCPVCGYTIDSLSRLDDDDIRPKAGDWTVCFMCAAVLVINADLTVRASTPEEFVEALADKELLRTRDAIQSYNAQKEKE
jgi:hypothetical protein